MEQSQNYTVVVSGKGFLFGCCKITRVDVLCSSIATAVLLSHKRSSEISVAATITDYFLFQS